MRESECALFEKLLSARSQNVVLESLAQEINGLLLAKLIYGINLRRVNAESIGNFLYRLPDFQNNLMNYNAEDNRAIKAKLEELLDNNCAIAWKYHRKRSRLIP